MAKTQQSKIKFWVNVYEDPYKECSDRPHKYYVSLSYPTKKAARAVRTKRAKSMGIRYKGTVKIEL